MRTASEHQTRGIDDDVAHLLHLRGEVINLEQDDRLGGLLHLVDRVVHRRDELADAAAVERRDERPPYRDQHVARDVVRLLLAAHDLLAIRRDRVATVEHRAQRQRALQNRVGMSRE